MFWRKICVRWESRDDEFAVEQPSAQQATDGKRAANLDFSKSTAMKLKWEAEPSNLIRLAETSRASSQPAAGKAPSFS